MYRRMTHRILFLVSISLVLAACGRGGEPGTPDTTGDEHEATEGAPIGESHHADEHEGMPAEVNALHDELAPIYH